MRGAISKAGLKVSQKNTGIVRAVLEGDPNQVIGIRSSRVYSQIARTGRNPQKSVEQAILITALNNAILVKAGDGKTSKIDPVYVPMKAKEIRLCFGNRTNEMPDSSFLLLER